MKLAVAAIGAAAILGSTLADAATLDFSSFSSGNSGLSTLVVGDGTFNVPTGTVFVYRPGDFGGFTTSGGMCALSGNCQHDFTLSFAFPVTNLVFEAAFFNTGDSVAVEAFDGVASVGSLSITADGTYNFGSARITSLSFDDSSTGAGFGFGDFRYDRSVPEPGTLALLGLGLASLAGTRRRKQ